MGSSSIFTQVWRGSVALGAGALLCVSSLGEVSRAETTVDLLDKAREIHRKIAESELTPETAAYLSSLYEKAYLFPLDRIDPKQVKAEAPEIIQELWAARMELRDKLALAQGAQGSRGSGEVSDGMIAALRNITRVSRYAEDMLGETAYGGDLRNPGKAAPLFSRGRDNLLVNPQYQKVFGASTGLDPKELRSGDVLMVRGNRFTSAAIARIGVSVPSQFSHMAMIYKPDPDEADPKKIYVVEEEIETGLGIHTLDQVLHEGMGQAALFRFKAQPGVRSDCPRAAAELMYQRAKNETVPYEFDMRIDNGYGKQLYCSKVIQQGYDQACGVRLPKYATKLDMSNRRFMEDIGVTATETFAPGDMEFDPRFDLVGEWRDYQITPDLRRKDMILTKIFDWMDQDGMYLQPSPAISAGTDLIHSLRARQTDDGWIQRRLNIPKVMTRKGLQDVVMLQLSGDPMNKRLLAADQRHRERTGLPMSPKEMSEELDRFRREGRLCGTYLTTGKFDDLCSVGAAPSAGCEGRFEEASPGVGLSTSLRGISQLIRRWKL